MFGFSWAEIALIMGVALVAIGPKDLPVAIRTVTKMLRKARGMASEFQTHLDEIVREADLTEVRSEISRLRGFDLRRTIEKGLMPETATNAASGFSTYTPPGEVLEEKPVEMPMTGPLAGDIPGAGESAAAPARLAGAAGTEAPDFIPPGAVLKAPRPPFIPPRVRLYGYH